MFDSSCIVQDKLNVREANCNIYEDYDEISHHYGYKVTRLIFGIMYSGKKNDKKEIIVITNYFYVLGRY